MPQRPINALREPLRDRLRAKWRGPRSFTAIVAMEGLGVQALRDRLAQLEPRFQATLPALVDLHSFRLCALPPATGERASRLLLNVVHDLPLSEHFARLIRAAGPLLAEAVASPCYAPGPSELPELLASHRVREQTLHIGAIRQSVASILGNQRLREAAGRFVDARLRDGTWNAATDAETIRRCTRDHVMGLPSGAGLPRAEGPPISNCGRGLRLADLLVTFCLPTIGVLDSEILPAIRRIPNALFRALAAGAYRAWWVYGAIPTTLTLIGVRLLESVEPDIVAPPPGEDSLRRLEAQEDFGPKNQVTIAFPVRPSLIRRKLLWLTLWGSERGCRHWWTNGSLAGIDTIHYARIMQIDRGGTMLFLSDYDGGLNRYLGDFLGEGSNAVIPISSNVAGCPKTQWMFEQEDPVTFGPRWRALIRRCQLETTVWYHAYPLLTVTEILANARFRDRLLAPQLSAPEARQWARSL